MLRAFHSLWYSFPVQLLINHLKKNKVLLLFWLLLFGVAISNWGSYWGLRRLLLDPEYLDQSGFWSFFILGISLGGFTMAFHITTYIFDIHKFTFVGALPRPFVKFCLNNSSIPLAFLVTYLVTMIRFQLQAEYSTIDVVAWKCSGLLAGIALLLSSVFLYLSLTSKDIQEHLSGSMTRRLWYSISFGVNRLYKLLVADNARLRVEYYLASPFSVGHTRYLDDYYDREVILQIFRRSHRGLILFELLAIGLLLALGLLGRYSFSQIPAAASGILFLTILVMLTGFVSFWIRKWTNTAFIALVLIVNALTKHGWLFNASESRAFGMRYDGERVVYSLASARQVNSRAHYQEDKAHTLQILNNWRKKFPAVAPPPKLVIICASGGGQKAALGTMRILQEADRVTEGRLMAHTMLMSCVSGGALGASYFRELYWRKQQKLPIDLYDHQYLDKIARNSLNPVIFSLLTNDILLDLNRVQYNGMTYRRDRGYALEHQVNKQTGFVLDKPLKDYRLPEFESRIPMMILAPTIINDGSQLFISPHRVSYMSTDFREGVVAEKDGKVKGIDFMRFFETQGAEDVCFMSALRMNATFPGVLPSVSLPSRPAMEVIDAGLFDNYGITNAVQFLYVFRDWIADNTSGVVLVTIRKSKKQKEITRCATKSLFQQLTKPINGIYTAWSSIQDIRNNGLLELANAWLKTQVVEVEFQYTHPDTSKHTGTDVRSLSWHLTTAEKQNVLEAISAPSNQRALRRLRWLLQ